MVEGPRTSEITSFDQIDQHLFQELLAKSSVWDFYEISKEEYMNKDDSEKKSLIIKFYNHMVKDKAWLFVSFLLSGFCVSDIEQVCVLLFSSIVLSVFSSIMRCSPVVHVLAFIVSSSEDKFCSVFDALPAIDSLSEVSVFDSSSEVKFSSELKYYFEKTFK